MIKTFTAVATLLLGLAGPALTQPSKLIPRVPDTPMPKGRFLTENLIPGMLMTCVTNEDGGATCGAQHQPPMTITKEDVDNLTKLRGE